MHKAHGGCAAKFPQQSTHTTTRASPTGLSTPQQTEKTDFFVVFHRNGPSIIVNSTYIYLKTVNNLCPDLFEQERPAAVQNRFLTPLDRSTGLRFIQVLVHAHPAPGKALEAPSFQVVHIKHVHNYRVNTRRKCAQPLKDAQAGKPSPNCPDPVPPCFQSFSHGSKQ